jgi:hypothetical protein
MTYVLELDSKIVAEGFLSKDFNSVIKTDFPEIEPISVKKLRETTSIFDPEIFQRILDYAENFPDSEPPELENSYQYFGYKGHISAIGVFVEE